MWSNAGDVFSFFFFFPWNIRGWIVARELERETKLEAEGYTPKPQKTPIWVPSPKSLELKGQKNLRITGLQKGSSEVSLKNQTT